MGVVLGPDVWEEVEGGRKVGEGGILCLLEGEEGAQNQMVVGEEVHWDFCVLGVERRVVGVKTISH